MQGTRSIRTAFVTATCAFALAATIGTVHAVEIDAKAATEVEGKAAQYTEKLRRIADDKAMTAVEIVLRWESEARAQGRWDMRYAQDMFGALMKLQPDNLVAASEATSYQGLMKVLMTGRSAEAVTPKALGDTADDLVYTPVTPCRIVDTRNAGGPIAANTTRQFDVDGSTFVSQGGIDAPCGIPFGVARAVVMAVAVTQPDAAGFFRAWGLGAMPFASFLNFVAGETIAVTTVVPVVPGGGADFSLYSANANAHAVIDVMGYYAAPVATPLDCIAVSSTFVAVPVNVYTVIDANCPAGRTVTGGGYFVNEGTGGFPGVWIFHFPNGNGWRTEVDNQTTGARNVQSWATCCRIPGR